MLGSTPLLRLLQLNSAALPVGAYAFSQGLEYGVEKGWLTTREQTYDWLLLQMREALAKTDIPVLQRQLKAVEHEDEAAFVNWNYYILACRETDELRLSDTATGAALIKLLHELDVPVHWAAAIQDDVSFVSVFALAAKHWQLSEEMAMYGLLWSWLENQVAAATKLVPLGQVAAQQLLSQLLEDIPACIELGQSVRDEQIGASLPAISMASSWHETQYSRLFRS